jgi:hypothetical protein
VTAAVEPPRDAATAIQARAEGRVVELASGLLMLLDAHRITGRLPLDAQAQAARLRHAVKLAVQATATALGTHPPAPVLPDPAGALRSWIASQPWAQQDPGPVGWVYLLCFRDPATGEHRPYQGQSTRGHYAGHYFGTAASSGLLKVLRRVGSAEFDELTAGV